MSIQEYMKLQIDLAKWYDDHSDSMGKYGIGSSTKKDFDNTNSIFISKSITISLCILSGFPKITPVDMAKAVALWGDAHPDLAKQYSNPMLEMLDALSFRYSCEK